MSRARVLLLLMALAAAGVPDAMVVPVLRGLTVERYGMSLSQAHLFVAVNVLGAVLAAGLLEIARERLSARVLLVAGASVNAAALGVIAMPIGAVATLGVRLVEGAADLVVYALLFDMLRASGSGSTTGRRMGLGATVMMLAIAGGMALGGRIGSVDPTRVLWTGAGACVVLALIGSGLGAADGPRRDARTVIAQSRARLWPALLMMFGDRAASGVFVSSVPLFLTGSLGMSPARAGGLVGVAMLLMALLTWPMGRAADAIGAPRVRAAATVLYASGIACLPGVVGLGVGPAALVMGVIGLGAAGLFASSLLVASALGRGAGAMGAYYAAGNLGFFFGPVLAGVLVQSLGGDDAGRGAFATVLGAFALCHAAVSSIALAGLVTRRPDATPENTPSSGVPGKKAQEALPARR